MLTSVLGARIIINVIIVIIINGQYAPATCLCTTNARIIINVQGKGAQGHPAVVVPPPPQLVAHRRIKQGDCSKGKGRGKGKGKSRDKIDETLTAHAFNAGAAAAYEQRHGKTETILMLTVYSSRLLCVYTVACNYVDGKCAVRVRLFASPGA